MVSKGMVDLDMYTGPRIQRLFLQWLVTLESQLGAGFNNGTHRGQVPGLFGSRRAVLGTYSSRRQVLIPAGFWRRLHSVIDDHGWTLATSAGRGSRACRPILQRFQGFADARPCHGQSERIRPKALEIPKGLRPHFFSCRHFLVTPLTMQRGKPCELP